MRIQQVGRAGAGAELRGIDSEPGSMGPRVEAACRFAEAAGALAGIRALGDGAAILRGNAGPASGRTRARRVANEL